MVWVALGFAVAACLFDIALVVAAVVLFGRAQPYLAEARPMVQMMFGDKPAGQ